MNRIQSSNEVLEISSFPGMLAGFCGVVLMGAVYGWFAGKASAVDLAIILFCIAVFSCLLDYRVVVISLEKEEVLIHSTRLISKKTFSVPISLIEGVSIRTGRGTSSHAGVVHIDTTNGPYTVTSMASMGHKKQRQVASEIKRFLGIV